MNTPVREGETIEGQRAAKIRSHHYPPTSVFLAVEMASEATLHDPSSSPSLKRPRDADDPLIPVEEPRSPPQSPKNGGGSTAGAAGAPAPLQSQDEIIKEGVRQFGHRWRRISSLPQLHGRSDDAVRNRWSRLAKGSEEGAEERTSASDRTSAPEGGSQTGGEGGVGLGLLVVANLCRSLATDGGGASSDEPWEQHAPLVNLRRALSAGSAAEGSGGDAGV
ncbi:hypothetical protein EMIHUDRAFT_448290 [Emiliania huxleyi CCMP1516]|uniref:Myb-like domain-containing protein n=2 Tax=Emiliania huxleyi TaxID=2903 RepID=A0A0D3IUJ5_EMIH1|nr:hypothetical protein EMIHUDRAFT_448290 [Emiliania huxleyi CCMP1516]EOD14930.1 hypothetical protein EMIHUDRAFT_448290 [Emiliania huxleyi CCMP1516]|eukprot:XP_005767359.1 hypothetical protein EMIHUDRAFT_448290 [Emiliania huxleyi CCMP1516]